MSEFFASRSHRWYRSAFFGILLGLWTPATAFAPDYQQVSVHLKQEYQMGGMELFAKGKMDQAIEIWELALVMDPDDLRTKTYLQRVYEQRLRLTQIGGDNQ